MTVEIPLTKGYVTIVDDQDADLLEKSHFAWGSKETYYAATKLRGRSWLIHRLIMQRILGRELKSSELVDHIDRNTMNNQRDNLRVATKSQNAANTKLNRNNKTGYRGVCWDKRERKYKAQIVVHGQRVQLGNYKTLEDAYAAYCLAAKEHFGDFFIP